jgi:hypothetical protein
MSSGAVIHVPSFIKIGSGVQKLIGGIHRHTHRQQRDVISLLYFFQNKKSRLKYKITSRGAREANVTIKSVDSVEAPGREPRALPL